MRMAFSFSDEHTQQFYTQGYTLFRGIVPAALIGDLRRACEQGCQVIRKQNPQAQRFQPVGKYEIEQQPFRSFCDLSPLRDAYAKLLSPRHVPGELNVTLGVLLEPANRPYCTNWHRDWIHHSDKAAKMPVSQMTDVNLFNQINCALYEDSSTWIVPGSHLRADLPGEVAAFGAAPVAAPNVEGTTPEDAEQRCLDYCRRMPGALQVHLNAGDLCIYRNVMWHIGNYAPYRKRATLHDCVNTPEYLAYHKAMNWPA
jgi:hypothetical protein